MVKMVKGLMLLILSGCATARGTHYVSAPIELPQQPVELAISFVVLVGIIMIGLSNRQ